MIQLPKYTGTSNKTIKAMVVDIRNKLREMAKPGANRIERCFSNTDSCLKLLQTDRERFCIMLSSTQLCGVIWLVDNKIEYISLTNGHARYEGEQCVGRTTPLIDAVKALIEESSPRGLLKKGMEQVRDYLQLCSKGSSGRVQRKLEWNGDAYHVWCTPGGNFMMISCMAKKEVHLSLEKGETSVSYEEYSKKFDCWMDFDDKQSCVRSLKLLKAMFAAAFKEKGIRVQ